MWRIVLVTLFAIVSCGDNDQAAKPALAPCLEEHTDLARPPDGQLPCELLPPGFVSP
ncbi:MAG: hypothetical protein AB7P03_08455 [Kofleriaceae bacterium]